MSFTCKGCPNRTPGCHDKCEKYQAEKAEHDAMKDKRFAEEQLRCGLMDQTYRAVRKVTKRKRKGGFYAE